MKNRNSWIALVLLIAFGLVGYFLFSDLPVKNLNPENVDGTPQKMTLSGTYVCLPHIDTSGAQTMECAFGLKTDDGDYYAVNFGQSGKAIAQFQSGVHIKAEGFVVVKEALSMVDWQKYNMKGMFTVNKMLEPTVTMPQATSTPPVQGKININVVCQGALAYMTFTDSKAADVFVTECKEGKHPEVIERFKVQMGLGNNVAI